MASYQEFCDANGNPNVGTFLRNDGVIVFAGDADLEAWLAVGNVPQPSRPLVRRVTGKQFLYALNHLNQRTAWDAAWPNHKQDDRDWFTDPWPSYIYENHKRIIRMLVLANVPLSPLFDQAVTE